MEFVGSPTLLMKMLRNCMIKSQIIQDLNYMNLKGTKFQLKVWNYLKKIPRGKVKTYLDVAKAIGKPKAFRAVANAVGKNPFPPKIPCHRVIRSDGSLGGYSGKGGINEKRRLLRSEKVFIK
jgi:methylated-DNA-[protein]-cysteine S-methyltransferase